MYVTCFAEKLLYMSLGLIVLPLVWKDKVLPFLPDNNKRFSVPFVAIKRMALFMAGFLSACLLAIAIESGNWRSGFFFDHMLVNLFASSRLRETPTTRYSCFPNIMRCGPDAPMARRCPCSGCWPLGVSSTEGHHVGVVLSSPQRPQSHSSFGSQIQQHQDTSIH